jgi:rRNA metabolism SBDS family protein
VADAVFTNFKKGNVAKASELQKVFGTGDEMEAAKIIVEQGDAQVSASERKQDADAHRRAVIGFLHKTYVDAKGLPHPTSRLDGVVDEAKVRLDNTKQVEKQAEEIVKKMQGKLVFVKSVMECTLFLEHKYARKCSGVVYKNCEIQKEDWDAQGCKWVINISPGDFDGFCNELNKSTGGDYQLAMGRTDPRENRPVEEDLSKKKKKKKRDKKKRR